MIALTWAQTEDMIAILKQRFEFVENESALNKLTNQSLSQKEFLLETRLKGERSFHRTELVFEAAKLQMLGHLHYSMDWIMEQLTQMLIVSEEKACVPESPVKAFLQTPTVSDTKTGKTPLGMYLGVYDTSQNQWKGSADSFNSLAISDDVPVNLPVYEEATEYNSFIMEDCKWLKYSRDFSRRYQAIINDYGRLRQVSLFTLRLEFRCHTLYFLDLALREGNYFLNDDANEPDPYIWAFNADLSSAEETMQVALPPARIRFIFDGLTALAAHVLIANIKYIKRLNQPGARKLVMNVRSLQQNLANVVSMPERELEKARQYYELLLGTGQVSSSCVDEN